LNHDRYTDEYIAGILAGARSIAIIGASAVANRPSSFAMKPKRTLKIGKEAFYRQLDMSLDEAYAYASSVMVENMLDAEAEEGIGAFIDKRQPTWPR
jgi:enoyl-CoA hydratase/carnithine racemase